METLTLTAPDDFHVHLRDNVYLKRTVPDIARQFRRAIIMPNLQPPVTQIEAVEAYRERILDVAKKEDIPFEPLMTLYLTQESTAGLVKKAAEHPHIQGFKLYPAGATTNSAAGIVDFKGLYPVFEALQKEGLPLLLHGEVTDPRVDVFDREACFIERQLIPMQKDFPELKIVLEHITTKEAVDYVQSASKTTAATITVHHLLYDRNALFKGGINPHFYCLPILKRSTHREALVKAATSGSTQFFLGTDSAPHAINQKEACCGCAGIYTAYSAIELYAEVFEQAQAVNKLEAFAGHFGADFYGLPRNKGTITLEKKTWTVPEFLDFGDERVKPLRAGEEVKWRLVSN